MILEAIIGSKKTTVADAIVVLWWLDMRLIGADSLNAFAELFRLTLVLLEAV